jgi:hypothetical protein
LERCSALFVFRYLRAQSKDWAKRVVFHSPFFGRRQSYSPMAAGEYPKILLAIGE